MHYWPQTGLDISDISLTVRITQRKIFWLSLTERKTMLIFKMKII